MTMMRFAAGVALAALLGLPAWGAEGDLCANPTQLQGFKTCADVAKAEAEGEVVIYSTNPELANKTLQRSAAPSCRVWRNPMSVLSLDPSASPVPLAK